MNKGTGSPGDLRAEVAAFAETLREEHGAELWMVVKADGDQHEAPIVAIESIVVPKGERGGGRGTAMMGEIAGWANRQGLILSVHPSPDFGGSVQRLRKFYRRFGFVPNSGRNKDFRTRDTMIRYPRKREENPEVTGLKRSLLA